MAMLVAGVTLSSLPAKAAPGSDRGVALPSYTNHAAHVSAARTLTLYVDRDFDEAERQHIVSAVRQWNHALNGFLQMRPVLLPNDPSQDEITRIRRGGGWIVARVDGRHPLARQPEGMQALAVTIGGSNGGMMVAGARGGFVYVISDRIDRAGPRDLTGVVMHELGHVLGAGHARTGLMGPVYHPANGRCIDREAVALVASAQRLPLQQLNWCVTPTNYGPPRSVSYTPGR
jgi:hypothetical protein